MINWFSEIGIEFEYLVMGSLLISLISLYFYQQAASKFQSLNKQLVQLQNEVRAINSGNLGMGRKISQFAEEIANVELGNLSQDLSQVSEKTYQQASLLLSRGATIEEVVESCDITPAEAELLGVMRHSRRSLEASI